MPDIETANGVTLANWRQAPWSTHSFHRVETLVPVAAVAAGPTPAPLPDARQPIDDIPFEDADGRPRTVGETMEATWTRGLVVLKSGRLIAERYGHGYDGTRPHLLFSVTKSFTGVLTGILAGRDLLDPEAQVTRYVPEVANSAYGDCTVRHVLDMTVSSSFVEDYTDPQGDYMRYRRATLWNPPLEDETPLTLHGFLATMPRGEEPHGHRFHYLSPNSDLLGWVLERAAGRPFADLLSDLVWRPMGAEAAAQVTVDAEGSARTGGGLCALARDLARFGEMMRLDGRVGDRQVVPEGWVRDIRTAGDRAAWARGDMTVLFPNGRYRSQWYQTGFDTGAFCAIGIHGQWLWIDPAREVVIAKLGAQPDPAKDAIDLTLIRAFVAIARTV